MSKRPESIDAYLAALGDDQRAALEALRTTIKAIVPSVEECISYQLPAFRYQGKLLVGIGATKAHCALYLMSGSVVGRFKEALRGFAISKGTIRFQPDHPLPCDIVRQFLEARIAELMTAT